ncbi:hypothetical protein [Thermincola ferriacetica]
MANHFGDAFGRTFKLLTEKWQLFLYPLLGSIAGFFIVVPVAVIIGLVFFGPLVNNMMQVSDDEAARLLIQYLFSPGAAGAVVLVIFILLLMAVQAYFTGAINGVFRDAVEGLPLSVAEYFRNGLKYWFRVFAVMLVGAAIFGVPVILYLKFSIIKNLNVLLQNPDSIVPSFVMGFIAFGLIMLVITLLYNLVTYFWLPSLIVGEHDFFGSLKESAKLGFKNILYLIALVVIQVLAYGILSMITNVRPNSGLLILLNIIANYIFNVYFGFYKFVWYDEMREKPNNIESGPDAGDIFV